MMHKKRISQIGEKYTVFYFKIYLKWFSVNMRKNNISGKFKLVFTNPIL